MKPKGAQMELRIAKLEPWGFSLYQIDVKMYPEGAKMSEGAGATREARGHSLRQKDTTRLFKVQTRHELGAQDAKKQTSTHIHTQPTAAARRFRLESEGLYTTRVLLPQFNILPRVLPPASQIQHVGSDQQAARARLAKA